MGICRAAAAAATAKISNRSPQQQHQVGAVGGKPAVKHRQRPGDGQSHRLGGILRENRQPGRDGHAVRLDLGHGGAQPGAEVRPGDHQLQVQRRAGGQLTDHRAQQTVFRPGGGDDSDGGHGRGHSFFEQIKQGGDWAFVPRRGIFLSASGQMPGPGGACAFVPGRAVLLSSVTERRTKKGAAVSVRRPPTKGPCPLETRPRHPVAAPLAAVPGLTLQAGEILSHPRRCPDGSGRTGQRKPDKVGFPAGENLQPGGDRGKQFLSQRGNYHLIKNGAETFVMPGSCSPMETGAGDFSGWRNLTARSFRPRQNPAWQSGPAPRTSAWG